MSTAFEEVQNYSRQFGHSISNGFKALIEEKHLYQNQIIEFESILNSMPQERSFGMPDTKAIAAASCRHIPNMHWLPKGGEYQDKFGLVSFPKDPSIFVFQVPTVKIFCTKCDRIEPFNPFFFEKDQQFSFRNFLKQLFFLQFQCQSCKGNIVSYLISREKSKLSIVGRDPIDLPIVDKDFPRNERKWISDALIARNCGQILPATFLVRTFIEQYLRRIFPDVPRDKFSIELLFENYHKLLPEDFKSRFPSFSKIYSDLSILIHEAREDDEILNSSIASLRAHFEAKRVFKID